MFQNGLELKVLLSQFAECCDHRLVQTGLARIRVCVCVCVLFHSYFIRELLEYFFFICTIKIRYIKHESSCRLAQGNLYVKSSGSWFYYAMLLACLRVSG